MQVSVETTSGLERLMKVSVPAERIEQDVNARVKQSARTIRIDGFRRGKVPAKVVKQRYGDEIRHEVLNQVLQESLSQAFEQQKLNPAGMPNIEFTKNVEGAPFEYTARFEVYPEIDLTDLADVSIEKKQAQVTDEDLDKMIESLRKQQADWSEVNRPAAKGDRLKIDFEGFVDGEAFEGGKAEGSDLVIGSNTMIPGFEDGLIGAETDKEVELNVTFPEQYQAEHLQGQEALFKVKVHSVAEQIPAEMNEEFFNKFGLENKTEEAFKAEVRKNMERELKNTLKLKLKDKVFSKLIELNQFDAPAALIEAEIDELRRQAVARFAGPDSKMDPNSLPMEAFLDQAERRIKVGLLMRRIIELNNIQVDAAKVDSILQEMAETYQNPEEVIQWYKNNQETLKQIEDLAMEEQILEQLLTNATITEIEVSYEDAIKPESDEQTEEATA